MAQEIKHVTPNGHGDYERRDIGVAGVLYFLAGLAACGILIHFLVSGIYAYLEKRSETNQPAVSPLIQKAPADTRHVSRDYPQTAFPTPRLEENERGQLDDIRLEEEQTLSTYGWVDQKAGTVRIPIDRAMDLLVQRGLPVRQGEGERAGAGQQPAQQQKGTTKKK